MCRVRLVAKLECDIHEAKRLCVRVFGWLRVFARAEKEEEAQSG